ncbi:MAG: hypothetical protein WCE97_03895 [Candidatus Cybelea sp.]
MQRAERDANRRRETTQSGEITGTEESAPIRIGNEETERRGKIIPLSEPCVPLRPSARALRHEMLRGPVGQYILAIAQQRATGWAGGVAAILRGAGGFRVIGPLRRTSLAVDPFWLQEAHDEDLTLTPLRA